MSNYTEYEARYERLVGAMQVGQYGKHRGRLVRRLSAGVFGQKDTAYHALGERFSAGIMAGDTVDEALVLQLRAAEIDLLIGASPYLPNLKAPTSL